MPLKMLIIDDEMPKAKGYHKIGEKYPEVFEIDEANAFVICDAIRDYEQVAMTKLMRRKYDLILLDSTFMFHEQQGLNIVLLLRSGFAGHAEAELGGALNRATYVIGVSECWDEITKILDRLFRLKGLEHGLDSWTHSGHANLKGLCAELDKFLLSRNMDPAKARHSIF